jgi:hypothetical protein
VIVHPFILQLLFVQGIEQALIEKIVGIDLPLDSLKTPFSFLVKNGLVFVSDHLLPFLKLNVILNLSFPKTNCEGGGIIGL